MSQDAKEYFIALQQKCMLFKQGAVKLLNTPSITASARNRAQYEFQDAQDRLQQIERQIEVLNQLPSDFFASNQLQQQQQGQPSGTFPSPRKPFQSITTDSIIAQNRLDSLIETLKNPHIPFRQYVDATNEICAIYNNEAFVGVIKYPSMIDIIPISWQMLMSESKPVIACGFKLLRYAVSSYNDIAMVYYLYPKYYHHDRVYHYPYVKYAENKDAALINAEESDLFDLYNKTDIYDTEREEDETGTTTNIHAITIKPVNSDLDTSQITEKFVKGWQPLLFLISGTLVEETGIDVMECVKFVRKTIQLGGARYINSLGTRLLIMLSESKIQSLAFKLNNLSNVQNVSTSVIEQVEMVISLVETSCELTIADTKLAYDCKVIKFLIQALIEPPLTISTHQLQNLKNSSSPGQILSINNALKNVSMLPLPVILKLLRDPSTRQYLIKSNFLPLLLSALLDPEPSTLANMSVSSMGTGMGMSRLASPKLLHISNILNIIMCTWSGMGLFLDDNCQCLRSLISGLYSEQVYVRTVVMSVIAGGLRIRKLAALTGNHQNYELWSWEKALISSEDGEGNSITGASIGKSLSVADIRTKMGGRCCPEYEDRVVNQFTAIFLQACLQCGLINTLCTLFEDFHKEKRARRWIALLLSEVLYLRSNIIPPKLSELHNITFQMNQLIERECRKHAKLNKKIQDEMDSVQIQAARRLEIATNSSEHSILSLFLRTTTIPSLTPYINAPLTGGKSPLVDQLTIEDILYSLRRIPSDVDIKPLIVQTHLTQTKEYLSWNWALISILIRGILWNESRFEEVLKTTKFFKRLVSFYKPQKAGFVQVVYQTVGDVKVPGFTTHKYALDMTHFLNLHAGSNVGADVDNQENRGKTNGNTAANSNDGSMPGNNGSATVASATNTTMANINVRLSKKQRERLAEMYVDVGIALFKLLLSQNDGVKVLRESGILQTVSVALLNVSASANSSSTSSASAYVGQNQNNGDVTTEDERESLYDTSISAGGGSGNGGGSSSASGEGLFGSGRIRTTLSWGYIRFIGVFSGHPLGLQLLEEYGVIDALYSVVNACSGSGNGGDSLVALIMRELDFNISGQLRMLVEKAGVMGSEYVRKLVTERLIGVLQEIRAGNDVVDYTLEKWAVGVLVRQSYDVSSSVKLLAVCGLASYVVNEEKVRTMLQFNPDLGSIELNGRQSYGGLLLHRVLGFDSGVEYVQNRNGGLIESIVEKWADERREWVKVIDSAAYQQFRGTNGTSATPGGNGNDKVRYSFYELFEQLVSTESGVTFVLDTGMVSHFLSVVLIYYRLVRTGVERELYGLSTVNRRNGTSTSVRRARARSGSRVRANGDVKRWEDRWVKDTSDAAGLVEETKCAIAALGYIGQTDAGIFAIESELEELVEGRKISDDFQMKRGNESDNESESESGSEIGDGRVDEGESIQEGENDSGHSSVREDDDADVLSEEGHNDDPEHEQKEEGNEHEYDEYDEYDYEYSDLRKEDGTVKDVVELLMEVHHHSVNWELRGSSVVAIGRLGASAMGGEVLAECGVERTASGVCLSVGECGGASGRLSDSDRDRDSQGAAVDGTLCAPVIGANSNSDSDSNSESGSAGGGDEGGSAALRGEGDAMWGAGARNDGGRTELALMLLRSGLGIGVVPPVKRAGVSTQQPSSVSAATPAAVAAAVRSARRAGPQAQMQTMARLQEAYWTYVGDGLVAGGGGGAAAMGRVAGIARALKY
jgi:hypothetical protein